MSEARTLLTVGLTGGIASGKSTVAAALRNCGAHVIDADAIVHELTGPGGAAVDEVVDRFGEALRGADGGLDREAMAGRVFADEEARRELEAILHPLVRQEIDRRIRAHAAREDNSPIVVIEAALLVETGRYRDFDRLVVTRCSPELQKTRLADRDGMAASDADARIAAQATLDERLAVADYVVDTDTSLEETTRCVGCTYGVLLEDLSRKRSGVL